MRRTAVFLGLFAPLLSALACGGRVGGVGDGGGGPPECPSPAAVSPGAACDEDGLTCAAPNVPMGECGPAVQQCTCENGAWSRCVYDGPGGGNGCVTPVCPLAAAVTPNGPCDLPAGLTCDTSFEFQPCFGGPVSGLLPCNCIDHAWVCAAPPPPAGCPDGGPPDVDVPDEGPDTSTPGCPPPEQVLAGLGCSVPGAECAGNPQMCDGAIFYDALQCEGAIWVTLATTVCGDAGPEVDADADAEVDAEDGGVVEDGGWLGD